MSPETKTEILFKLSLTIGDTIELVPMLNRFLAEMLEHLEGVGAAILQLHQPDPKPAGATPAVCMLPETLPREPSYSDFWEDWAPTSLDQALAELPDGSPLVSLKGDCALHAFRLPGFGVLIFLRDASVGVLSTDLQRALAPLLQKLANAARACLLEARLNDQTQRLQLATDSAGIGIWEWDPLSDRLDWDAQTQRLCGLESDAPESGGFRGRLDDWIHCMHPSDQPVARALVEDSLRDKDHFALEYRVVCPGGEERYLRTQAMRARTPAGEPPRLIGATRDITPARHLENLLRESRDLAQSANQANSHFIANMAHEIRTPLNGILGLTELVLDADLSAVQRDYVDLIRYSADALLNILNDILDLAKMDAGRMQIEAIPFNLSVMITEMLKSLVSTADKKGLTFVFDQLGDLPPESLGDPGRIRQMLVNICYNAIKFTDKGEIRFQVHACPDENPDRDLIQISISDTGIGIRPEKLEEIFTAFTQGNATVTRQFGGTGLGLSISARLARLMGGRIWVESEEGVGSTFFLALPLARTVSPEAPVLPMQHWPDKRVLIADDHPVNRRTLAYWFKQWGFAVQEAGTGLQALAMTRENRAKGIQVDVYLFDSALPELDGFGFAQSLKDAGLAEHSHMIMVSSVGRRGDAQRCRELGISAFLTKPVTPLELRETLTHVLNAPEPKASAPLLTRHHLIEHRQRLRILLVDDNKVSQKLAGSLLREWGHEVSIASDGRAAVDLFRAQRFHLIFMDLYMPGMDGIAATRAIRELEQATARTPIIAMMVNALESDAERCRDAGMDEHITKPLQPAVLEEIVLRFARGF
ncbi:hybrid sensor histidine kinase/response regulator [Thiocystis violacea]|uniref:hybrid sensor histidine kinase/response regulator n=1 Tax=Thiocystis violacea TaxID=13725 RepID=UPI0019052144|nr:response regulator [Thiocystis violacea]MBK1723584.1 hypothetical protein [Thiocystis violacea]